MTKRLTWFGGLVIAAVTLIIYQPDLRIGHEGGWWYLDWVSRFSTPEYIIQFFDPGRVTQGYRPMQGMMILVEYWLFQFNADGYHVAQMLMHMVTSWLLLALVWRVSQNARLAVIAALFYTTIPALHLAVFRAPAVVDPWAGIFYLGTIWLWLEYLRTRRARDYALTQSVFALALLSKEVSVFLPAILYLLERWFSVAPNLALPQTPAPSWPQLIARLFPARGAWGDTLKRYAGFVGVLIPYLALELNVQAHGEFSSQFGYQLGLHFLFNLIPYLAMLVMPWSIDNYIPPAEASHYVWLILAGGAILGAAFVKRSAAILFLIFFAVINISPLLGFPLDWFQARYLYFSYISVAILLAMLCDAGWNWTRRHSAYWRVIAAALALIVLFHGQQLAVKAAEWSEFTRAMRVPFRDISRQHPTYPANTLLYFLYPTTTSLPDFKGLFLIRYGQGLTVSGTDDNGFPAFRDFQNRFFYYFDEKNAPREIVGESVQPRASVTLPADFDAPLRLEGFYLARANIPRGEPLVVLLHWTPRDLIRHDYTVFVHLLDANGRVVAQSDSQPRRGAAPTSKWVVPQSVADAILLPTNEIPAGTYRLAIGVYDQTTMQRFVIPSSANADAVVIAPIEIR